jgi:hypothetical protein
MKNKEEDGEGPDGVIAHRLNKRFKDRRQSEKSTNQYNNAPDTPKEIFLSKAGVNQTSHNETDDKKESLSCEEKLCRERLVVDGDEDQAKQSNGAAGREQRAEISKQRNEDDDHHHH